MNIAYKIWKKIIINSNSIFLQKLYNMSADVMEPMIQVAKKLLDCSDEDLQVLRYIYIESTLYPTCVSKWSKTIAKQKQLENKFEFRET